MSRLRYDDKSRTRKHAYELIRHEFVQLVRLLTSDDERRHVDARNRAFQKIWVRV